MRPKQLFAKLIFTYTVNNIHFIYSRKPNSAASLPKTTFIFPITTFIFPKRIFIIPCVCVYTNEVEARVLELIGLLPKLLYAVYQRLELPDACS